MVRPKSLWEQEYHRRQAGINAYAREHCCPRVIPRDKLLVYHPGEYRRYLVQHPCTDCPVAAFCDLPCQVYLNWYNARIQAARIRAGWSEGGGARNKI